MILSYAFENFYSFKEGCEISFYNKRKASPVICLIGANASGKSNILKALKFLINFCSESFNYKPDDGLPFESYFNNDKPSKFELSFKVGNTEYFYQLTATTTRILTEKLSKKVNRRTTIFCRKNDKIAHCIKQYDELKTIKKFRNNASVISTSNQYEIQILKPVFDYFRKLNFINHAYNIFKYSGDNTEFVSELLYKHKRIKEFTKRILISSDTGIVDVEVVKNEISNSKIIYYPIFTHLTNNGKQSLLFHQQSSGTQRLYKFLALFFLAIKEGSILIFDELDTALHPDIIIELINLFKYNKTNKNLGQFIFATHSVEVMSELTKYQIIFTGKEECESYAYSLSELSGIRNDRNILSLYKANKIGGRPKVTSFG